MDWTAFGPLVLPYATTVSPPLLKQHARLAAIEFLSHTKAWQADLAPLVANGVLTSFTMVPPTDAKVEKLISVTITDSLGNVTEAGIKTEEDRGRLARRWTDVLAATPDRTTLIVTPAQPNLASIVVKAALKPTLAAASLPDEVFEQYGPLIAKGALASLTAMADKPWTDLTTARIAAAEFIDAKATTARQVERGFAKSSRRSAIRWF